MKRSILFFCGYLLLAIGALVGAIANVVESIRDEVSVQTVLFALVFLAIFGIGAHLAVIWFLRILKNRGIDREGK
jgi:hypothetical protein